MKRVLVFLLSCLDEIKRHIISVWLNFIAAVKNWWEGPWWRKIIDIALAFLIALFLRPVLVGMAAANFIDGSNTFYAAFSITFAFLALEVLALWFLEVVLILAAIQVATITKQVGENYERRMKESNGSQGVGISGI
jgi:hypothetical protein